MEDPVNVKFLIRRTALKKWYKDFFLSVVENRFTFKVNEIKPDFIFHEAHFIDVIKYSGIRIAFAAENVRIDFNISDYGIGFDHLEFQDRYLRFPLYLLYTDATRLAQHRSAFIKDKKASEWYDRKFCNFLVSNGAASEFRVKFFNELSKSKQVHSGGGFMNNVGRKIIDKYAWQSEYKFSLCFENSSTSGYLTEKLIEAYASNTVPIYWGDPDAFGKLSDGKSGINQKAVIWVDENNISQSITHILEVDSNEELYMAYLNEPLFLEEDHVEIFTDKLAAFLFSIFSQDRDKAFRRGFGLTRIRVENRTKARSSIFTSFIKYFKKRLKK